MEFFFFWSASREAASDKRAYAFAAALQKKVSFAILFRDLWWEEQETRETLPVTVTSVLRQAVAR